MSKRSPTCKAILDEFARGSERSSLFWWLAEHHDEIIEQADGKRMRWEPLCALFAAHGLTDVRGHPASPRTARETWLQVRRVVKKAKDRKEMRDAAAPPGLTPPSRISPDWHPRDVPPLQPAASPRGKDGPPNPEAVIARLRKTVNERSGRKE